MSGPWSSSFVRIDSDKIQAVSPKPTSEVERLIALRFSYLIRQHLDRGWSLEKLGAAIGCSPTLLSKWREPHKVRQGLAQRKGISAKIVFGVRAGLRISSEVFAVSSKDLPGVVVMPDGTERPADPDEVDVYAAVFSLDKKRSEIDLAARKQLAEHQTKIASLEGKVDRMETKLDRVTLMLERLLGTDASNRT